MRRGLKLTRTRAVAAGIGRSLFPDEEGTETPGRQGHVEPAGGRRSLFPDEEGTETRAARRPCDDRLECRSLFPDEEGTETYRASRVRYRSTFVSQFVPR